MKAELHKVTFQAHGVLRDSDGQIVEEIHCAGGSTADGQPVEFKLYPHQLDRLGLEVAAILANIEAQHRDAVKPRPVSAKERGAKTRANGAKPASSRARRRTEVA